MAAPNLPPELDQMVADLGPSTVRRALGILLSSTPAEMAELRQHAQARARRDLHRLAHNLKGRYGMFGLQALRETALQLELAADSQTTEQQLKLIAVLESRLQELEPALREFVSKLEAAGEG